MALKHDKELSDLRQRVDALAESIANDEEYERPGFQQNIRTMPPTIEQMARRIKLQNIVSALEEFVGSVDEYLAD